MSNDNLDMLIAKALSRNIDATQPSAEFYSRIAALGLRAHRRRKFRRVMVAASVALLAVCGSLRVFTRDSPAGDGSAVAVWNDQYVASVAAIDARLRTFDETQMQLRDTISDRFPYAYNYFEK